MITIWKTILEEKNLQEIEVPDGAKFLHVAAQNEQVCLWCRCNSALPKRKRLIVIVGTGHTAPAGDEGYYIGTAILYNGSLVLHVFELTESI